MNTEVFTGKAEVYAKARPGYPQQAIDYICTLVPDHAVFADIGAGTGKLTLPLAQRGYQIYAVEPNTDMRSQLTEVLAPYPNVHIVAGTAETTTLTEHSVDAVICAQALHWFDLHLFREECRRIGKADGIAIAVYNTMPGGNSEVNCCTSTSLFFVHPARQTFINPIAYTRENWLAYRTSHSHDPLPSDPDYAAHIAQMNAIFDRDSVNGLLHRNAVTEVYSEKIADLL